MSTHLPPFLPYPSLSSASLEVTSRISSALLKNNAFITNALAPLLLPLQAEERAADSAALGMYSKAPKSCAVKGLASARDSLLGNARISLVKSLLSCPANLQWKVWLAGARLELSAGSLAKARRSLLLSLCRCACLSNACSYFLFL